MQSGEGGLRLDLIKSKASGAHLGYVLIWIDLNAEIVISSLGCFSRICILDGRKGTCCRRRLGLIYRNHVRPAARVEPHQRLRLPAADRYLNLKSNSSLHRVSATISGNWEGWPCRKRGSFGCSLLGAAEPVPVSSQPSGLAETFRPLACMLKGGATQTCHLDSFVSHNDAISQPWIINTSAPYTPPYIRLSQLLSRPNSA